MTNTKTTIKSRNRLFIECAQFRIRNNIMENFNNQHIKVPRDLLPIKTYIYLTSKSLLLYYGFIVVVVVADNQ